MGNLGWKKENPYEGGIKDSSDTLICSGVTSIDTTGLYPGKQPQFALSPDFSAYNPLVGYTKYNSQYYNINIEMGNNRTEDYKIAAEKCGIPKENPTPDRYVWHHLFNTTFDKSTHVAVMQLIPSDIHNRSKPHLGARGQYDEARRLVEYEFVSKNDKKFLIQMAELPNFLSKVFSSNTIRQDTVKKIISINNNTTISCHLIFGTSDINELIKESLLEEESLLIKYKGLFAFGMDCSGNTLACDTKGMVYLVDHELYEVLKTGIYVKDLIEESMQNTKW